MAFETELTGKTRYSTAIIKKLFSRREVIVLQVEESYWYDRDAGCPYSGGDMVQLTCWRDAKLEDLNIVFKEK